MDIKIDTSRFMKISESMEKQVRYATMIALSDTAIDVAKVEKQLIKQSIDRPTAFTVNAPRYIRATRSRLVSQVYLAPIQAAYLRTQITGGTIHGRKPAPTPAAENKFGNLPKGALKRKGVYTVKSSGRVFTFKRSGKGKSTFIATGTNVRRYSPIFPFYERGISRAQAVFPRKFGPALRKAIATAR